MITEKMTIHRALCELKTIDSRIAKKIGESSFCTANKTSNSKIGGKPINEYVEEAKNNYKSILALINRRNAIKRAVSLSNAVTEITIGGKTFRVAEAIEMKNSGMDNFETLVMELSSQLNRASGVIKRSEEEMDERADKYVIGLYGSKEKAQSPEVTAVRDAYIKANTCELIDPINIKAQIDEYQRLISDFQSEVDSALSVSNAITEIEFSYEA